MIRTEKGLRKGFTTGACGAAAAKAAAILLFGQNKEKSVKIALPKGGFLTVPISAWELDENSARCAVIKDSGDDPDITNGVWVFAAVSKIAKGIRIDGGEGVGRVTKKGLDQPVGCAAINRVPRQMIKESVMEIMEQYGYGGGLSVTISIPGGEALAEKTFNPRLGIVGGLSILGTRGIVEPMSQQALFDSIQLEIHMKAVNGCRYLALTPGNYGQEFIQETLGIRLEKAVKISNFVGDSLQAASDAGITGVLLVGHIGKLVKLAGGITQTHSMYGDCRLELIAAHSALAGADRETVKAIMEAATTEQAVAVLEDAGLLRGVMESLFCKIEQTVKNCLRWDIQWGVVMFSSQRGILAMSAGAEDLAKKIGV